MNQDNQNQGATDGAGGAKKTRKRAPRGSKSVDKKAAEERAAKARATIDGLVAAFKRNCELIVNENAGNKITKEVGTGLYHYIVTPVDELVAGIEAALKPE